MFDTFLKVIDTLIKFSSEGSRSNEKKLKEIVEPLFNELTPVVDDYFFVLKEARNKLSDKSYSKNLENLGRIKDELRELREKT